MCSPACDAELLLGLRTPTTHMDKPPAWRVHRLTWTGPVIHLDRPPIPGGEEFRRKLLY
jgi:hypothetical protein